MLGEWGDVDWKHIHLVYYYDYDDYSSSPTPDSLPIFLSLYPTHSKELPHVVQRTLVQAARCTVQQLQQTVDPPALGPGKELKIPSSSERERAMNS